MGDTDTRFGVLDAETQREIRLRQAREDGRRQSRRQTRGGGHFARGGGSSRRSGAFARSGGNMSRGRTNTSRGGANVGHGAGNAGYVHTVQGDRRFEETQAGTRNYLRGNGRHRGRFTNGDNRHHGPAGPMVS